MYKVEVEVSFLYYELRHDYLPSFGFLSNGSRIMHIGIASPYTQ